MALTISGHAYNSLFEAMLEQTRHLDPEDEADIVVPYPSDLGRGQIRSIELREDSVLKIESYQQWEDLVVACNEQQDWVRVGFHLSGFHRSSQVTVCPGEYSLSGSGINPEGAFDSLAIEPVREITFNLSAAQIQSFFGELPIALQPLIKPPDQVSFAQTYRTTSAMQIALQQLLQCPYHGILKHRYLETKVWELLLLVVAPLLAESQVHCAKSVKIKSEEVDRIHAARKILLQRLDNPPSLMELARLVGLNDRALKQGFRACFGTTTFGYLHQYRLEQARQLLAIGDLKIEEVAQRVGFSNRSYFAEAFRKKFGTNPGEYARQQRQRR